MRILIYATGGAVFAGTSVAAFFRAGGHKARCVEGGHLTEADREAADVVVAHDDVFDLVRSVYPGEVPVIATSGFADPMTLLAACTGPTPEQVEAAKVASPPPPAPPAEGASDAPEEPAQKRRGRRADAPEEPASDPQ